MKPLGSYVSLKAVEQPQSSVIVVDQAPERYRKFEVVDYGPDVMTVSIGDIVLVDGKELISQKDAKISFILEKFIFSKD